MSKFQLYCTCTVCKSKISTQNLNAHFKSKHTIKSYCLQCNAPIYNKDKKFCNTSCAAVYNNNQRSISGWTQSDKQRLIAKANTKHQFKPRNFTPVKPCKICNKFHPKTGNTCSDVCRRKYLSLQMRKSISNTTFNPNANRGRNKRSYMERSFEQWLNTNYQNLNYITEYPFKRYDIIKTYFGDFYFPELALVIELDGTQHLKTIEYDKERDEYISSYYNVQILRISHKDYVNKTKLDLVHQLLST